MNDDKHSGRPKSSVNKKKVKIACEFIKRELKSSLSYMKMELNMSNDSIHPILTENLRLRKVCAGFIPHKLTNDQKLLRIQYCKDFIKEEKRTQTAENPSQLATRRGIFNIILKPSAKVLNRRQC